MKKLTLLLLFISTLYFSQNQRFIYEYRFTIDSTKVDTLNSELMYLDVTKEGSKFYSRTRFVSDSIMNVMIKRSMETGDFKIDLGGSKYGKVREEIEKTYPDYDIFLYNKIGMNNYKVSDKRKLNWKILPEKEQIDEFETQKATVDFAGRSWTAWFTTEIPIQDGPYKFHGLPGLIVKMEDASKTHLFDLKGVENLENQSDLTDAKIVGLGQMITVDNKKFKKAFLAHRKDPNKSMQQMFGGGGMVTAKVKMVDQNGKELNMKDMMRDNEKRQKAKNERENNFLEKDILD